VEKLKGKAAMLLIMHKTQTPWSKVAKLACSCHCGWFLCWWMIPKSVPHACSRCSQSNYTQTFIY